MVLTLKNIDQCIFSNRNLSIQKRDTVCLRCMLHLKAQQLMDGVDLLGGKFLAKLWMEPLQSHLCSCWEK